MRLSSPAVGLAPSSEAPPKERAKRHGGMPARPACAPPSYTDIGYLRCRRTTGPNVTLSLSAEVSAPTAAVGLPRKPPRGSGGAGIAGGVPALHRRRRHAAAPPLLHLCNMLALHADFIAGPDVNFATSLDRNCAKAGSSRQNGKLCWKSEHLQHRMQDRLAAGAQRLAAVLSKRQAPLAK